MKTVLMLLPLGTTLLSVLLFSSQAQATGMADSIKFRGGTFTCGGNHFSRIAGIEQHRTAYVFRNFNKHTTITIDRFQVFDANGNVLFDYPGIDLPASVKAKLGPHQTTQINTADILVGDLDSAARPIQSHVEWSYDRAHKDMPLNGSAVRTVRAADTGTELSRSSSECKLIGYQR